MVVCVCAGAVLLLAAAVAADTDQYVDDDTMNFLMASRYGRSSETHMEPGNDNFYMVMRRYGKRSARARGGGGAGSGLLCRLSTLFPQLRCTPRATQHEDERSADEAGAHEGD